MRFIFRVRPVLLLLCLLAGPAFARATIDKIEVKGLDDGDDAEMIENIEVSLSLYEAVGKEQGESRLEYLLAQAERQTREALEPFGYYSPTIELAAPRTGDRVTVVITVDRGEPVRVRTSHISITGWAEQDRYLGQDLKQFEPR
ncbi:POTRA domain-containing protein, partial [Xanthomonas codiaei]